MNTLGERFLSDALAEAPAAVLQGESMRAYVRLEQAYPVSDPPLSLVFGLAGSEAFLISQEPGRVLNARRQSLARRSASVRCGADLARAVSSHSGSRALHHDPKRSACSHPRLARSDVTQAHDTGA